jgi:hypothetical protein
MGGGKAIVPFAPFVPWAKADPGSQPEIDSMGVETSSNVQCFTLDAII